MYIGLHVKHPLFLSDFNETWIFSKGFRKIFKYQISWKLVQWGPSCSIGQTNIHDEANIRFSQFFERAQKCPRSRVPSAAQPSYGHFREFSYKFLAFLTIGIENIRYPWPSQLYETFTYSNSFFRVLKATMTTMFPACTVHGGQALVNASPPLRWGVCITRSGRGIS